MMIRFRRLFLFLLLTMLVSCASTTSEVHTIDPDLQVWQIRPGVWVHRSWHVLDDGARFYSNGLIVQQGSKVALIDTAWGNDETDALVDWIERELRMPVAFAIGTHFHADRVGGAAALAKRGIPLYGSALTRDLALTEKTEPIIPVAGLEQPGSVKRFGTIEVFYPGAGHTRDNVVVWIANERILHGGCAVRPGTSSSLGNTADADVAAWPASMERVMARYPGATLVISGHGEIAGFELLRHTREITERAATRIED